MRPPVVLVLAVGMVMLAACCSDASEALGKRGVVGIGVAITEFHDDEGIYSPLLGLSGCAALMPVRWCGVVADVSYGRWTYTAANEELFAVRREVEATYLDIMPALYWDLGPKGLAYVGAGAALAMVSIDRRLDAPPSPHSSYKDLGEHFGFCLGAGIASRVAGRLSILVAVRDRLVSGRHRTSQAVDHLGEFITMEKIPVGGLQISLGLGVLF